MFGLKKKNSGEFPDLSLNSAPSIRDYQRDMLPPIENLDEKESIHGLPSFPDSLMNKGFSQSMIKSAVEDEDKNLPELPEWHGEDERVEGVPPTPVRTVELDEWSPRAPPLRAMDDLRMPPSMPQINEKRPLFVKLDKFKEARDSLVKISDKLGQMDELLKMIKDLKAKEDEEITAWEKDIENIKMRIAFVNKEIFDNAY